MLINKNQTETFLLSPGSTVLVNGQSRIRVYQRDATLQIATFLTQIDLPSGASRAIGPYNQTVEVRVKSLGVGVTATEVAGVKAVKTDLRHLPFGTGNILGQLSTISTSPSGSGTFIGGTCRMMHQCVETGPVSQVSLCFTNYGPNNTVAPAAVTVKCAIELVSDQSGTKYPLMFNGQRTWTLAPGGLIWSDPINLDLVAGQQFWSRTMWSVPNAGDGYGYTFATSAGYFEGVDFDGVTPTDKVDTGTITLITNRSCWGPVCVRGLAANRTKPIIGIFGDSICTGTDDTINTGAGDTALVTYGFWRGGWVTRGLASRVPYVQSSRGGEQTINQGQFRVWARNTLHLCDHVISATGVNDLTSAAATLQASLLAQWKSIRALGPQVWQATITPRTTSSDGWVTVANQTISADNSKRVLVNEWLRDGAPLNSTGTTAVETGNSSAIRTGNVLHPLSGIIEVTDYVETDRNSGIWKAAYTTDGIHPQRVGYVDMAQALSDLSRFGYTG
jgi:lysophospholipase L1-like esterase